MKRTADQLNAEKLSLRYWPIRARACICIVAAGLGKVPIDVTECDEDAANWPKGREETPFAQLPTLQVGNEFLLAQSVAIANFLARRGGILGDNEKEFALSQMLMQEYGDIYDIIDDANYHPVDKVKAWKETIEVKLPRHAAFLEKILRDDGTFTGRNLIGEGAVYTALCLALDVAPKMLDQTPKLQRFYQHFKALPELQEANKIYESWSQYFKVVQ